MAAHHKRIPGTVAILLVPRLRALWAVELDSKYALAHALQFPMLFLQLV